MPALPASENILELALCAGILSHQSGGDTHHTGALMRQTAFALGADVANTVISSVNLGVTVEKDGVRSTAFRKAPHMGVNFCMLIAVSRAVEALAQGRLDAAGLQEELTRIARQQHHYRPELIAVLVGLACGGFCAFFGGDAYAIAATSLASMFGMAMRLFLHKRHYKPFLFVTSASFTALTLTGLLLRFLPSQTPDAALAASVLFLVPGVPLINGAADLFSAHYLNGMVRLMMGGVFVVGIAVGVSLGLRVLA